MKHGSLFSGIGGFDLAAEWMGWENVFHCEWNPFGKRVLKHYWPDAESFDDITKTDFKKYHGTIDIISGGFPCQPYSAAGKRLGKEDERHLWPHMLRAIAEIAPRFVVGENVRGLTNWNGGMVFNEVCSDLENLGYSVAPYLIPACATNAPHKRERIWFIANTDNARWGQSDKENENKPSKQSNRNCIQHNTTNTNDQGLQRSQVNGSVEKSRKKSKQLSTGCFRPNWQIFPIESPVCGRNDGLSTKLDGITFPKWRTESVKAYGNAVVPNVIFEIFKAIEKIDQTHD